MPRACGVCASPERVAIDAALARPDSTIRDVAGRFGLSKSAVDRHHRQHPRAPVERPVERPHIETTAVEIDTTTLATQTPARDRRAVFVREYLVDLNATQAAIRAGYSPRTAGSQASDLLKIPEIQAAIQAAMDQRAQRVGMTADDVLRELKAIGMSRVDHYEVGDAKQPLVVKDGAPPEAIAAVSSVKRRVRRVERNSGQIEETEDVEFKLWNKPEALRLAGQHLKLFSEQGESSGAVEKVFFLPVVAINAEDWQRQVAERKALPSGSG